MTVRIGTARPLAAMLAAAAMLLPAGTGLAQSAVEVAKYDARDKDPAETLRLSTGTSKKQIVLVARGFDQTILQQGYSGLLDLRDAGVPSSYVVAPAGAAGPEQIEFQYYAAGMPFGPPIVYPIAGAPLDRIRADIGRAGDAAQGQLAAYLKQRSDPNFIDTRAVPNEQGKSLIVANYKENVVIAVFGGDFTFQNRIYQSLLAGGKLPPRWKFIWVSAEDIPPDQAIMGFYAGGEDMSFRLWTVAEYAQASQLAKEAAPYLDDWYYRKTNPELKFTQGYFFMEGMIISEKAMDAAVAEALGE